MPAWTSASVASGPMLSSMLAARQRSSLACAYASSRREASVEAMGACSSFPWEWEIAESFSSPIARQRDTWMTGMPARRWRVVIWPARRTPGRWAG
jgi:hypothetical protein